MCMMAAVLSPRSCEQCIRHGTLYASATVATFLTRTARRWLHPLLLQAPARTLAEIRAEILAVEKETEARIAAETADMTMEERMEWFNSKCYSDPALEELAVRMRQSTQAKPTDSRDD